MKLLLLLSLIITLTACSGSRPENLGVYQGTFTPCPNSPNCVSSFADKSDQQHAIAAIAYADNTQIMQQITALLEATDNARIVTRSEHYLYAEFVSDWMGYVDDVEFYHLPEQQLIHVRSASRLGYGDMGVNRKRIEMLRSQLVRSIKEPRPNKLMSPMKLN